MKTFIIVALLVEVSLVGTPQSRQREKPTRATAPLTRDEIEIYRLVLREYTADDKNAATTLNLSNTTFPLDSSSSMSGMSDDGCLKDIHLDNIAAASRSFHNLPAEVLADKRVRLVDPKAQTKVVRANDPDKTMREGKSVDTAVEDAFRTALFSVSEIAFDKDHRYAVVSYRFWCGSLCGNGSTWVFQKFGSEWKKTDRNCGGWIS